MKISKEFERLFPKSTWTDEEIAESMFIPDDETGSGHINKGILKIDEPIDDYAKNHNMIDLEDFINEYKNLIK